MFSGSYRRPLLAVCVLGEGQSSMLSVGLWGGSMKRFCVSVALFVAFSLLTVSATFGQSLTTGDVTGTITDPSGAVAPNVSVTLKSVDTGEVRTTTTSSAGTYRFSLLRPGGYTITTEAHGFSKTTSTVTVTVGQTSISDIKMELGVSSTTVEVTTAAPLIQSTMQTCRRTLAQAWSTTSPMVAMT